jgi:hypothetical protein
MSRLDNDQQEDLQKLANVKGLLRKLNVSEHGEKYVFGCRQTLMAVYIQWSRTLPGTSCPEERGFKTLVEDYAAAPEERLVVGS